MTDAEIDALARRLLTDAVQTILSWDAKFFHEIYELDGGELVPVYGAESQEGYGAFLCEYMPLATIKKLIKDCEEIFDDFVAHVVEKADNQTTKEQVQRFLADDRDSAIR